MRKITEWFTPKSPEERRIDSMQERLRTMKLEEVRIREQISHLEGQLAGMLADSHRMETHLIPLAQSKLQAPK